MPRSKAAPWQRSARVWFALFLLLPVALFAVFYIYPVIDTIRLSFQSWNGLSPTRTDVGLSNYQWLLGENRFYNSLMNNIRWLVFYVIGPTGPGLLLALLFMMGTQSALFGPVKYAILPQHLAATELVKGNAWVNLGTFVSILLGTLLAGVLWPQWHSVMEPRCWPGGSRIDAPCVTKPISSCSALRIASFILILGIIHLSITSATNRGVSSDLVRVDVPIELPNVYTKSELFEFFEFFEK